MPFSVWPFNSSYETRPRAGKSALGIFLSCILVCLLAYDSAFAEIRKDDIIAGTTIGERSLNVSLCPSIESQHAILVNEQGEVFFERNATDAANIASVTKIMTAIIALESAPLDITVVVSQSAALVGESTASLRAGDTMVLSEALKGLMIPSGNDAALAIAQSVGKLVADTADDNAGTAAFVELMNKKAAELGCEDTLFENPHGLDFDEYAGDLHSTAADVAIIARYAMQHEYFREIVDMRSAQLQIERNGVPTQIEVISTDELLGIYEGACGIKTGYTELAGACFAGACERDGKLIYAIVLNAPSESQRFTDTMTLYNWYYDHHIDYKLAHDDEMVSADLYGSVVEVPVVADVALSDRIDATIKATFADPDATVEIFTPYGNISQEFEFFDVSGAVESGEVVGVARFYQRNEQIAEIDVIACEKVDAPSFFEIMQTAWQRFCALFTGENTVASSVVLNHTPTVL